jgi:AcrR family transcriptional regulator
MEPLATTVLIPKQARALTTRRRLLDAAVEELVDRGYGALTTLNVARRAGVSRGAQQNHFPRKEVLVAEAIQHLAQRQINELAARVRAAPDGSERLLTALDILFEQYSGPLFAAVIDLSFAARTEPDLHEIIRRQERAISDAISDTAITLFGQRTAADARFAKTWATVLSTVRGLAFLKLLGHPTRTVDAQWRATRATLMTLLAGWDDAGAKRQGRP